MSLYRHTPTYYLLLPYTNILRVVPRPFGVCRFCMETCPLTRATTALLARPLEMPATRVVPIPQHNTLSQPLPAHGQHPSTRCRPTLSSLWRAILDDYPRSRHGGVTRGRVSIGACSIVSIATSVHYPSRCQKEWFCNLVHPSRCRLAG
jgi:hypothetical protein